MLLGIGWWLSVCLGACALVVRVPLVNNVPWLVVGGYLCTFELVPWWLLLGMFVVGGYLHALELVPWWLVGWWLLVCLGACALVVAAW